MIDNIWKHAKQNTRFQWLSVCFPGTVTSSRQTDGRDQTGEAMEAGSRQGHPAGVLGSDAHDHRLRRAGVGGEADLKSRILNPDLPEGLPELPGPQPGTPAGSPLQISAAAGSLPNW